jgi:VanZ family protein
MNGRRPRWAWLVFPQLSIIVTASVLASCRRLPPLALHGGLDKVGHFAMLGALSLFAVGFLGPARWLRVVLALGALSALEEASQAFFPARTVDAGDLAANLLGIAIGGWTAAHLTGRRASYAADTLAPRRRDNSPRLPISPDDDHPDDDRPAHPDRR